MYFETVKPCDFVVGDVIKIYSIFSVIGYPIWHYGVVVGYDDVVHFNLSKEDVEIIIIRTSLKEFVGSGRSLQKCLMSELHAEYSPNEISKRAISCVGSNFGGYNLFSNNCEHFANWCVSGTCYSNQVLWSEGEHTAGRKFLEKTVYEPAVKVCEAGVKFCDKQIENLDKFSDAIDNFLNILGL